MLKQIRSGLAEFLEWGQAMCSETQKRKALTVIARASSSSSSSRSARKCSACVKLCLTCWLCWAQRTSRTGCEALLFPLQAQRCVCFQVGWQPSNPACTPYTPRLSLPLVLTRMELLYRARRAWEQWWLRLERKCGPPLLLPSPWPTPASCKARAAQEACKPCRPRLHSCRPLPLCWVLQPPTSSYCRRSWACCLAGLRS
mmetsp:Transcript_24602/g.67064  ORF Transcript_24602/g.67064 Transcript_24602/m.67064 type:complete len:200 (+) Transcript_24602:172-771(+)